MSTLIAADWVIFVGYLVLVFGLGVAFARSQHTNEDYFVGGRRMNWSAVGISLFATAFSSLSFVMLPREGAYEDYHLLVTILMIPLLITPLLWWLFVPVYLRLGITSVYEYLEIRFNRPMRLLGTILFACYAVGWMGSMLYAVGLILQAVIGLTPAQLTWTLIGVGMLAVVYTTLGGVRAVIWTDVLQAATLGGGMIAVLILALGQVHGGWDAVVRMGIEHGKFDMLDFKLDLTKRDTVYAACAFALFMYLPGYTTSQVTVQRYVCVSSLRQARGALLINGVVVTLVSVLFFFVGSTLFAYYNQPGMSGFPDLPKQDQLLPHFVSTVLPNTGLTGLLLAGLFAAAMSTMDSGINSMTAVVVYDWLGGRHVGVGVSRVLCGLFGVAIIAAALLAPYLGEHVITIITKVAGTFLGLLLGVFLLGMLVPRANAAGAFIGLAAGAISLSIVWIWTSIPHWWYGAFTCIGTFLVGTAASRLFPAPSPDRLRGLAFPKRGSVSERTR
ncbi:MAG: sodium/solute symporter [Phycisphaerae bacterium]|nr:sodium/solute symporter [Phycisphaerae bacterium]